LNVTSGLSTHISGFDDITLFPSRPFYVFHELPATLLPNGEGLFQSIGCQSAHILSAPSFPLLASAEKGRPLRVFLIRVVAHKTAGYGVPKMAELVHQNLVGQCGIQNEELRLSSDESSNSPVFTFVFTC